ncbi:hypothetical protein D1AOALGA4SA_2820 [Olavius algarvensis Delta 1 endosymbiont]|nr:hypothetical protein D1AOALGA4SA_2820 [Olavius algarvensis Delta 1 endosymbiont]
MNHEIHERHQNTEKNHHRLLCVSCISWFIWPETFRKFLFRSDRPFDRLAAGLNPEPLNLER